MPENRRNFGGMSMEREKISAGGYSQGYLHAYSCICTFVFQRSLIASIAVFAVSFTFFLQDGFNLMRIIVSVSAIYAILLK